jgi:hypothetical protein
MDFKTSQIYHTLKICLNNEKQKHVSNLSIADFQPVLSLGNQQQSVADHDPATHENLRIIYFRRLFYGNSLLAGLFYFPDTDSHVHEEIQL